jgi:glycosyltransferase involved in cell wall biosynthesis
MRVALDGTPLLGARTGVGEVVHGIAAGLAARDDVDVTAYAVTAAGRDRLATALPAGVVPATRPFPARLARALWARVDRPRIEHWTGPVDVVHATNFVGPPARAPVVVTVHDLTFVRFPELCTPDTLRYPRAIRRALDRGAHVQVPSDFVAGEVCDEFGLPAERVTSVHWGLGSVEGGEPGRGRQITGAARYVLALGTVEPRKNLPVLVAAFDRLANDDHDLVLVVAGPDGWGVDAFADAVATARHRARVRRLGWVDAARRRDLLAGAAVFAYPSRYEGFGFPPLEAMAAGVPVVAARAGAVPEIVGDAAVLVAPDDVDALAGAIGDVLADPARRADLVRRGEARAGAFTWDAAVAALVDLYRRVGDRA